MRPGFLQPQAGGSKSSPFNPAVTAYGSLLTKQWNADNASPVITTVWPISRIDRNYNVYEFSAVTTSGTCSIQLYKNGSAVTGAVYAVSSTNSTPTAVNINLVAGDLLQYVVLSSPSPSSPANITVTVDAALMSSLAAGTASTTSSGDTVATVTATDATGGAMPYTYQWKRSITSGSGFVPLAGATSLTLNDSGLTNGTTYYYVLAYTDAGGAVVTSNQVTASPVGQGALQFNKPSNSGVFIAYL